MRTTLDLDPELVAEVERLTGVKGKSNAINAALVEYVRWKAVQELRSLAGKIELVDNWRELEELELEELREQSW